MTYFSTGVQLQAAIDALPASKKGDFKAFDGFYYGDKYMAAYSGTLSPLEHFVQIGAARGYAPSAAFDPAYYAGAYADLKGTDLNSADLLYHFLKFGLDEGRVPNATLATFNGAQYLTNNPDVATFVNANLAQFGGSANNGALAHFVKFGQFETGRTDATPVDTTAGATIRLTASADFGDDFTGTANNDTFNANVVQNALGQQVNTLGSGDELNGGGGMDTLSAKITSGVFAGGAISMPIQPETKSIEIVKLQAVNSDINGLSTQVYVNAKDMTGISKIGSNYSDADLVIQSLTTKDDAGNARNVSEMTVGMEYTGNADTRWNESDLSVYFDQDYLTQQVTNAASVDIRLMNQDAYDLSLNSAGGLTAMGIADSTGAVGPTVISKFKLTVGGNSYDLASKLNTADPINSLLTYTDALAAINAVLATIKLENPTDALLQTVTATLGGSFFADSPVSDTGAPGAARVGTAIVLSATGTTTLTIDELLISPVNQTQNDMNLFNRSTPSASSDSQLAINVDLEKVGLAGDGGALTIGSMNKAPGNVWDAVNTTTDTTSGIEQFDIAVKGANDKSSSLSALQSTNNNLRVVNVVTDAALTGTSFADLTIGNSQTIGLDVINKMALEVLPNSDNDNALKDVQTFDASGFKGDLTLFAGLTSEVTAKYMDLVDEAPAAAADDNVTFTYTGGTGDDYFNIALDSANLASAGTTTREDFNLSIAGGAGSDFITLGVVDSALPSPLAAYDTWYENSKLNANLRIEAGSGDDTIWTPGSGDVVILGGAGNDTVYSDNTGGKAVWAFNGTGPINNLLSDANNSYNLFKTNVSVNFKGLTATATISNVNGVANDLAINQAIKRAINSDPVLNKLLLATDGPANTLVVTSLIDGDMTGDLAVSLVAPTAAAITTGEYTQLQAFYNVASPAAVLSVINAGVAAVVAKGDYDNAPTVVGTIGTGVSDHTITGGADNDVIVLSTQGNSNETLVYAAGFGNDTVVNFDVAGPGIDQLNFTALLGGATGVTVTNDVLGGGLFVTGAATATRSIVLDNLVAPVSPTVGVAGINNNSAALVANLFADSGSATVAKSFVYVAVNTANNIGTVYTVSDAVGGTVGATTTVGGSNVVATLQGTIDLADTLWSTLTAANFVGTPTVVVPVGPSLNTVTVAAPTVNEGATATFTLTTSGVTDGTVISYALSGTGITAADVVGGLLTGTATVTGNVATVNVALAADSTTEGAEVMTLTATLGTQSLAASVTVNDTSLTPAGSIIPVPAAGAVGTAAADTFTVDAVFALADAAGTNYQSTITGFDLAADTLQIKMAVANPAITTLAQLIGEQGITVLDNPFFGGGVGSASINLGNDANGNEPVTIDLVAIAPADWANVSVQVI